ncbi:MAG TPA: hypoxanthine phosphoribosyltransferase [Tissierellia bacterium]|jgi:hypoxanthine phosphoribosyltransferase|nr:hypoxanthine phosphoribosyltransferase [Tissierellia bacterium]
MRELLSEQMIQTRVRELASEIRRDYEGKKPLLIGILKGSFVFLSDLIRELNMDLEVDFMATSSYGDATTSSGVVALTKDLDVAIEGRDVIIVEDIVDTGLTLSYLCRTLDQRLPSSLAVCALLDKSARRETEVQVDYCGFDIEDGFVVGYGIDYAQKFRHLPYIAIIEEEVHE